MNDREKALKKKRVALIVMIISMVIALCIIIVLSILTKYNKGIDNFVDNNRTIIVLLMLFMMGWVMFAFSHYLKTSRNPIFDNDIIKIKGMTIYEFDFVDYKDLKSSLNNFLFNKKYVKDKITYNFYDVQIFSNEEKSLINNPGIINRNIIIFKYEQQIDKIKEYVKNDLKIGTESWQYYVGITDKEITKDELYKYLLYVRYDSKDGGLYYYPRWNFSQSYFNINVLVNKKDKKIYVAKIFLENDNKAFGKLTTTLINDLGLKKCSSITINDIEKYQ